MLENATFDFYSDVLGRHEVPDKETFDQLAFEQKRLFGIYEPYVMGEKEEFGKDKTVCMWVEEQYRSVLSKTENGELVASFSLSGYSESRDNSRATSLSERKEKWLKLFCHVDMGLL